MVVGHGGARHHRLVWGLVCQAAYRRHKACGLVALLVSGQVLLDMMQAVRVLQAEENLTIKSIGEQVYHK